MSSPVRKLPPRPIINQRSASLHYQEPSSSGSSSPTSLNGPPHPASEGHNPETHTLRSSASLPNYASLAVKFAPLPTIEPRKRKSNVQLGVAARSRMIQQRRASNTARSRSHPPPAPLWTDLDEEAVGDGVRREVDDDDPFEVFGTWMVGKGKHLWRRVAQKKSGEKGADETSAGEKEVDQKSSEVADAARRTLQPERAESIVNERQPTVLLAADSEGRVWEEGVGESVRLQLLQIGPDTQVNVALASSPKTISV
ncbi:hypothetical protein BV25DRAFT_677621 [Artomyces pyxidatus]|uniref:Uncharacterized protein n=1 Tax=Artomyces pyxidatus TaxID=48021 RepID=A0ACB8T2Y2_9AGAM|nr:hypothetical protein BV25DRAFT_677621 [Artomyces pyxidatus]